jgi:hypothetical protein
MLAVWHAFDPIVFARSAATDSSPDGGRQCRSSQALRRWVRSGVPRRIAACAAQGPDGKDLSASAHVFGNDVGEPIDSIKTSWRATCPGQDRGPHLPRASTRGSRMDRDKVLTHAISSSRTRVRTIARTNSETIGRAQPPETFCKPPAPSPGSLPSYGGGTLERPVLPGRFVRLDLVGASGFEPPTPRSRTECSTRLSHAPTRREKCARSAHNGREPPGQNQHCTARPDSRIMNSVWTEFAE